MTWNNYTHNPHSKTNSQLRVWAEDIAEEWLRASEKNAMGMLGSLPSPMRGAVIAYTTVYISDPDLEYPEAEPDKGMRFARGVALASRKWT